MANLFYSEAPHSFPVCNDVWSANGDGRALTYKASSNLQSVCCVGNHPSKQIEQGTHYIILNLLNEESVSGESSGRFSL